MENRKFCDTEPNFYLPCSHLEHAECLDGQNQRLPAIPIEMKLKENKERKMLLDKQKQKQKCEILRKRRQKQQNVQRILKERQANKEGGKIIIDSYSYGKTYTNRFEDEFNWKKCDDIAQKIENCRNRAKEYQTIYRKKIKYSLEKKKSEAIKRKFEKERTMDQRSVNFHLAEWKQYEKKIAHKHKGEKINDQRLYEGFLKKNKEIQAIIEQHKKLNDQEEEENESCEEKKAMIKKQERLSRKSENNFKINVNPLSYVGQISTYGLQKSIKTPDKLLKQLRTFLQQNVELLAPSEDPFLLQKFENFLSQDSQL